MKRVLDDRSWNLGRLPSARKSNGDAASTRSGGGELIHFADLAREAADRIQIEKSLRELALRINRTQQTESLQIGLKLHDALDRFLASKKPNVDVLASPPRLRRPG